MKGTNRFHSQERGVVVPDNMMLANTFFVEAKNKPNSKARYAVFAPGDIFTVVFEFDSNLARSFAPYFSLYRGHQTVDNLNPDDLACVISGKEFYNKFRDADLDAIQDTSIDHPYFFCRGEPIYFIKQYTPRDRRDATAEA